MPNRVVTTSMAEGLPREVAAVLRADPAAPYSDPTLGVLVATTAEITPCKHPLVTVGDSLTHGFQSLAIHNTGLSWPAIVAWEMGVSGFRYPSYNGYGGLPLNIEWLLHELEQRYGEEINFWELVPAAFSAKHLTELVDEWWERGRGSHVPPSSEIMHNLAVFGFDLRDALAYTATYARSQIESNKPSRSFLPRPVANAQHIAALRVLESARSSDSTALSPLQAAAELGKEGIDTLVVMLGANNALATVVHLKVVWSGSDYQDLTKKNDYTVWLPSHFESEFKLVIEACKGVNARRIIFGNVPHVTIAPIARGVGGKYEPGSRYFPYYTRPWISDSSFNAREDPCLTSNQARAIDSVVDAYNEAIAEEIKAARTSGKDWYLLDVCGTLDRLATRRYLDDPSARPDWWTPYELPPAVAALTPPINSRFFSANRTGRTAGGIFSLDGVHPTTIGYGIIAQEVINIMRRAGARFVYGDGVRERVGAINVDFERLIRLDSLITDPPTMLDSALSTIGWLDQTADVFGRLLPNRR